MLEELHRLPEEKRRTEIVVHVGIAVFALFALAELIGGFGVPVVVGAVAGAVTLAYAEWLRGRWNEGERSPATLPVRVR